jgi:uncharacterized membrane protein YfcA
MNTLLYFSVVLIATALGAATGMGGGVIIKPALDLLGDYPAETTAALSCATVLTMSIVSVGRYVKAKIGLNFRLATSLAIGALVGGNMGNELLAYFARHQADHQVKGVQNIVLAALLVLTFCYMLRKDNIKSLHLDGLASGCLTGLGLGVLSSFLGIGGGPINVAAITFLFSVPTSVAAAYSLATILFAQIGKMAVLLTGGEMHRLWVPVLPALLVAAILGGWIGASLHRKLSSHTLEVLFNAVQLLVFGICIYNIVFYLL